MLGKMIQELVDDYQREPRNKIFLGERLLLTSASEETGSDVSSDQFRKVVREYLNGAMSAEAQAIYDGAVYACGASARLCFGSDPEQDVDYGIDWLEQIDGTYVAEVRPT
jgi:hypothetical protein